MTSQFRGNAEEEEREARTRTQAQRRPKLEQERSGARKVVRVALDRSRQHGHFIWDRNSQLWFNPRTRYFYNQETNSYSRAPDGVFYTAAQIQALNHIRQQFVEKRPAGFFWDPKSNMGHNPKTGFYYNCITNRYFQSLKGEGMTEAEMILKLKHFRLESPYGRTSGSSQFPDTVSWSQNFRSMLGPDRGESDSQEEDEDVMSISSTVHRSIFARKAGQRWKRFSGKRAADLRGPISNSTGFKDSPSNFFEEYFVHPVHERPGPNGAPRRFPGVGKSVADYFLVLGTNREDPAWGMRPSVLDMYYVPDDPDDPAIEEEVGVDDGSLPHTHGDGDDDSIEAYRQRKAAAAKARKRAKKKKEQGLDLTNIMEFAFPLGIQATMEPSAPQSHIFVLTDADGDKTYAAVVAFSEYVPPRLNSILLCEDLCAAYRTFLANGARERTTRTDGVSSDDANQSAQARPPPATGQEDDSGGKKLAATLDVLKALFDADPLRKNPPEYKAFVRERLNELGKEAVKLDAHDAAEKQAQELSRTTAEQQRQLEVEENTVVISTSTPATRSSSRLSGAQRISRQSSGYKDVQSRSRQATPSKREASSGQRSKSSRKRESLRAPSTASKAGVVVKADDGASEAHASRGTFEGGGNRSATAQPRRMSSEAGQGGVGKGVPMQTNRPDDIDIKIPSAAAAMSAPSNRSNSSDVISPRNKGTVETDGAVVPHQSQADLAVESNAALATSIPAPSQGPGPSKRELDALAAEVLAAMDDDSHDAEIVAAIADEDAAAAAAATAKAMEPVDSFRKILAQKLTSSFARFAKLVASHRLGNSYYVTKCFCICSHFPLYSLFDGVMHDLLRLVEAQGTVRHAGTDESRRRAVSKRQLFRQQQIQQHGAARGMRGSMSSMGGDRASSGANGATDGVGAVASTLDVDVLGNAIAEVVADATFSDDDGDIRGSDGADGRYAPVQVPLERAVMYFMRDVALPPAHCKVEYTFQLFPGGTEFKVSNPSPYALPVADFDMATFFQAFKQPRYVTILVGCALCETKTIFVSHDTSKLGVACETLRSLLHPLNWEGPFIPVLPNRSAFLGMLGAPTPIIVGVNRSIYDDGGLSDFRGNCTIFDLDNGDLFIPDYVVQTEVMPVRLRDRLEEGLSAFAFGSSGFQQDETRQAFHGFMTDLLSPALDSLDPVTMQFDVSSFVATSIATAKGEDSNDGSAESADRIATKAGSFFFDEFTQTQMFMSFTTRVVAHCRGEKLDLQLLKLDFDYQMRRGAFDANGKSNGGRFDLLKHPDWLAEATVAESNRYHASSAHSLPWSSNLGGGFVVARSMVEETLVGLDEVLQYEASHARRIRARQSTNTARSASADAATDAASPSVTSRRAAMPISIGERHLQTLQAANDEVADSHDGDFGGITAEAKPFGSPKNATVLDGTDGEHGLSTSGTENHEAMWLYEANPGKIGSFVIPRLDFTAQRAVGPAGDRRFLGVRRDLRRAMYAETVALSLRDAKMQLQDLKKTYSALNPIDDNLFALSAVTDTKVHYALLKHRELTVRHCQGVFFKLGKCIDELGKFHRHALAQIHLIDANARGASGAVGGGSGTTGGRTPRSPEFSEPSPRLRETYHSHCRSQARLWAAQSHDLWSKLKIVRASLQNMMHKREGLQLSLVTLLTNLRRDLWNAKREVDVSQDAFENANEKWEELLQSRMEYMGSGTGGNGSGSGDSGVASMGLARTDTMRNRQSAMDSESSQFYNHYAEQVRRFHTIRLSRGSKVATLVYAIPEFRAVLRTVLKRLGDDDAQCLDELRYIFAQCSRYLRIFLDNIARRTAEQFLPQVTNLKVLLTLKDLVPVDTSGGTAGGGDSTGVVGADVSTDLGGSNVGEHVSPKHRGKSGLRGDVDSATQDKLDRMKSYHRHHMPNSVGGHGTGVDGNASGGLSLKSKLYARVRGGLTSKAFQINNASFSSMIGNRGGSREWHVRVDFRELLPMQGSPVDVFALWAKCNNNAAAASSSALEFFRHQAAVLLRFDYNHSSGRRTFHHHPKTMRLMDKAPTGDRTARNTANAVDLSSSTAEATLKSVAGQTHEGDPAALTKRSSNGDAATRGTPASSTTDLTGSDAHGTGRDADNGGGAAVSGQGSEGVSMSPPTTGMLSPRGGRDHGHDAYGWTNVLALNGEAMREMERSFESLQHIFLTAGKATEVNECRHLQKALVEFARIDRKRDERREKEEWVAQAFLECEKVKRQLAQCDRNIKEIGEHRESQVKRDTSGLQCKTLRLMNPFLIGWGPKHKLNKIGCCARQPNGVDGVQQDHVILSIGRQSVAAMKFKDIVAFMRDIMISQGAPVPADSPRHGRNASSVSRRSKKTKKERSHKKNHGLKPADGNNAGALKQDEEQAAVVKKRDGVEDDTHGVGGERESTALDSALEKNGVRSSVSVEPQNAEPRNGDQDTKHHEDETPHKSESPVTAGDVSATAISESGDDVSGASGGASASITLVSDGSITEDEDAEDDYVTSTITADEHERVVAGDALGGGGGSKDVIADHSGDGNLVVTRATGGSGSNSDAKKDSSEQDLGVGITMTLGSRHHVRLHEIERKLEAERARRCKLVSLLETATQEWELRQKSFQVFLQEAIDMFQNAEKNRVLELLHEFKKSTELKLETVRAGIRPMEDLYTSAKRLDPKKDLKEYFGFNSVLSRQISRLVPKSVAVVDEQVGSAANFDGEEASGLDSAGLHTQHQRHAGGAGDESDSGHDGMYAAYMDQFENGRTVLKQHQKFAIYCTGRMEATAAKLVAVLDAGREAIYGPETSSDQRERAASSLGPDDAGSPGAAVTNSTDVHRSNVGSVDRNSASGAGAAGTTGGNAKDSNRHLRRSPLFVQVCNCINQIVEGQIGILQVLTLAFQSYARQCRVLKIHLKTVMDLIRLHKKALDTNLHNLKVDYQKQFDAEQQLNFQNTSGSGQLTDVQVFQGFNQEQSTWEKKVLFDIARRAHSAQMAQIVLFMQRQCKAALTVVHRDIIQVVQNAFVTAVTDFNANIAEQTATLHRRMKSRSVFCEAFQATKAVIDRALQFHNSPFFPALRERDDGKTNGGLKEPHPSMTEAHAAAMAEGEDKQRNAKHKRHGPEPLRFHQAAGQHGSGAQGIAEAKHDSNLVQQRNEGERGKVAGEIDSAGDGIAFPRLPSTMSDIAGLSDNGDLDDAVLEDESTEAVLAGSGISAADIHSAGYSIVSALTDNLEEELDLLCGLYDKVLLYTRSFSLDLLKLQVPDTGLWFPDSTTAESMEAIVSATKAYALLTMFPAVSLTDRYQLQLRQLAPIQWNMSSILLTAPGREGFMKFLTAIRGVDRQKIRDRNVVAVEVKMWGVLDAFLRKVHYYPDLRWRMDLQRVVDEIHRVEWKDSNIDVNDAIGELENLLDRAWSHTSQQTPPRAPGTENDLDLDILEGDNIPSRSEFRADHGNLGVQWFMDVEYAPLKNRSLLFEACSRVQALATKTLRRIREAYRRDERGHQKQFKRMENSIVSGNERIPTEETLKLCDDPQLLKGLIENCTTLSQEWGQDAGVFHIGHRKVQLANKHCAKYDSEVSEAAKKANVLHRLPLRDRNLEAKVAEQNKADAQRKANVICREIAPMAAVEYVESLERFVCETAATTHWLGGQLQTAVLERMHLKVRNVNIEHDMRALRSGGRSPARRMASSSGSDFESEGQGLDAGSPFMHGRRLGL